MARCEVCDSFGVMGLNHTYKDDCLCRQPETPEKPKRLVTVQIRRHGSDPKLVYVKINTEHGEFCVNADLISVYVDGSLPDPMKCFGPVTISLNR